MKSILDYSKLDKILEKKGKDLQWLLETLPCAKSTLWYWRNTGMPTRSARSVANLLGCETQEITKEAIEQPF